MGGWYTASMAEYLVSYELMTRGKGYEELLAALRGFGGRRILWAQWLIDSPLPADRLCRYFSQYLSPNDRLIVMAVGDDRASRNALRPIAAAQPDPAKP